MIRVTDHAMERLIERGSRSPILLELFASAAPIREAIASRLHRACIAAESIGQTSYHITLGGLRFVVRDRVVVTVLDSEATRNARKNGIARASGAAQL